jgi:hypothetical protein
MVYLNESHAQSATVIQVLQQRVQCSPIHLILRHLGRLRDTDLQHKGEAMRTTSMCACCRGTAQYDITADVIWTTRTHPLSPEQGTFWEQLVIFTHNSRYGSQLANTAGF